MPVFRGGINRKSSVTVMVLSSSQPRESPNLTFEGMYSDYNLRLSYRPERLCAWPSDQIQPGYAGLDPSYCYGNRAQQTETSSEQHHRNARHLA